MAKRFVLTTPITPTPRTSYDLALVTLDFENRNAVVEVKGDDGARVTVTLSGTDADPLLVGLMNADLRTIDGPTRILNRLATKLEAGAVQDVP